MSTIKVGVFKAGKTEIRGVGFSPAAIFFYTAGLPANGYGSPSAVGWEVGNGYAARGDGEAVSTYAWDGGAVSETQNLRNRALEFPRIGAANGRGTMHVVSYDPDGFTVSYPALPSGPYIVGYVAFNCAQAQVFSQIWDAGSSNVFHGIGFQPDLLSLWVNGAGVDTIRTTGGSPSFAALGTSLGGRNTAQTVNKGSTVTRSNDIITSSLVQSRSWANKFGPYGSWGGTFQGEWSYDIASWDSDGFTLVYQGGDNGVPMALLGMALRGDDMFVETGVVSLAADMSDVVIATSDVVEPKAFMFHTRSSADANRQGDQFQTVAVSTGAFDGVNQFHIGTSHGSRGQSDSRYCVKFDTAGEANAKCLKGISIVGNTLTLQKQQLPVGGETFEWLALGLGGSEVYSLEKRFPL